eukprot:TRINITY_DN34860_c0_g1_i1.p1 TRINITY_DN34860_c0_g1~~TRINITY_DN34860_c0_g1_i1.p1  ORF type:complete len:852 (-),score=180.07 TRINITY_DN34860_c0_g1_i1:107-2662(-)
MRCLAALLLAAAVATGSGNQGEPVPSPRSAISADIKARVEAGEGVPFFDERFSCREDGGAWSAYRELVEYGRLQVFDPNEGESLARELALSLAERTYNVTEVLQCNIGVIAGYHLLARRYVVAGDDWKAYRLLQLALIYVFTLRNALKVPPEAARDWATRTDKIVEEIKILKDRLSQEQQRRYARLPEANASLRIPGLRVAIVSICAYPKGHPLVLREITPENRHAYASRHGYGVHVHYEHPMPDRGVHIQHSKLQLVADYLRSGEYDWVAWLDCDSIIMNLDRTLDSVVHRYARKSARVTAGTLQMDAKRFEDGIGETESRKDKDTDDRAAEGVVTDGESVVFPHDDAEPLENEVLEAKVAHVGSCNSDAGCRLFGAVRVNPRVSYVVTVRTAQIDMEQDSEKLASVSVGGKSLGECNPHPDSDFDCRLHNCFNGVEVPQDAVAKGFVTLEVHAVRTHSDCRCSRLHGICYSAALAAFEEATDGEKVTDPSYGAFVVFTLTPAAPNSSQPENSTMSDLAGETSEEEAAAAEDVLEAGCSCKHPAAEMSRKPPPFPPRDTQAEASAPRPQPAAALRQRGAECEGADVLLGISVSLPLCLQLCREVGDCRYVAYGVGHKRGQCHWQLSDCLVFEEDAYMVYDITPTLGGATSPRQQSVAWLGCSQQCAAEGDAQDEEQAVQDFVLPPEERGVDLLITEEGWGLSSANWLIRRSEWSIAFLERAFELCHEDMPLFGDQDAMIHLLFNSRALSVESMGDPLDPHAVIVPQRELNAYDALNAHYMGCDAFEEGDLLVTFPGCKDPAACNPIFNLAAAYANGSFSPQDPTLQSAASLRLFGPPELAAELFQASRAL